jgi:hypothetical protein
MRYLFTVGYEVFITLIYMIAVFMLICFLLSYAFY